jgi:hypothetical protein
MHLFNKIHIRIFTIDSSNNLVTDNFQFDGDKVLSATFNNISVISWQLVLLVEETGENCGMSLINLIT